MTNKNPPRQAGDPMPTHRPSKFTEHQLAEALRAARGVNSEACRVLMRHHGTSVTVPTMGRLVAASPHLQAVKASIENIRLDYVETALWHRIEAGDPQAIHFFLRTKGASRGYGNTVKHQGDAAAPIHTIAKFDFKGMPLEELRTLQATLSAARERAVLGAAKTEEESA